MTFSASFRVHDVGEDASLPGRVQVNASVVDGTVTGSIVSGEVSLVLAAGADVAVDDNLQISGWVRTLRPATAAGPGLRSDAEQRQDDADEVPTP